MSTTTYTRKTRTDGPGYAFTTDTIYLRPEAHSAVRVYFGHLAQRRGNKSDLIMDRINPLLDPADASVHAQLVRAAWQLADTVDLVATAKPNPNAQYEIAEKLLALHDEIDPSKAPVLVYDESTHCRHDRPYSGNCTDCDADA